MNYTNGRCVTHKSALVPDSEAEDSVCFKKKRLEEAAKQTRISLLSCIFHTKKEGCSFVTESTDLDHPAVLSVQYGEINTRTTDTQGTEHKHKHAGAKKT